ncbi:alkaline phosphatase family protein [Ruania zhangjianzhongii]|uniref:alkaline phosphatase family protein n=1 Tax=Ruania zhangjianzhongii TaxID=2603206 RepID=UPI0011CBDC89|nr:alkaline phosphatase family protein [Ruania zhangjianzhongii]
MSVPAAHVLVVGVDGVRYDTLVEVDTPHLDAIAAAGFRRPVQVHPQVPTISGPSWATMVTGVLPGTHRIYDNDLSGHALAANPDFVHLARRAQPDLQAFIGADWQPLVTAHSGGPLFADGGYLPDCRRGEEAEPADWHRADQLVTDAAATFLAGLDGRRGSASFVYLHGCDTAGHQTGVSERYRELVRASDERVGQLVRAVDARVSRAEEDWVIIAATDHGHRPEGGHGGDSPEERTAWIAAQGAGVPDSPPAELELADVAGHAFSVLGLTPRSDDVIGVPFGQRDAGTD